MRSVVMALGAFVWLASLAGAEEFGSVEGQFLLDGEIPRPQLIAKGGVPMCTPKDIEDESLVVNPKNKGIANIFIYLRKAPASIDPSLKESRSKEVVFDNNGCRYVPHAVVARTDQKVRFTSSDAVAHSIHTYTLGNPQQNFILKANDAKGKAIHVKATETLPMPVKCDIHPWMRGMLLVVDHPYAGVTDADGKFKIEGLPEGEHSFRVWHEIPGYVEREWKVTVTGGRTTTVPAVQVPVAKLEKR